MTKALAHPGVAYGFWRYGPGDLSAAIEMMEAARDAGITHFDTADVYGEGVFGAAEALLGEARKKAPSLFDGIELATKIGIEIGSPYNSSKEYLARAIDASLKRLQTDCVDLLYIHRPDNLAHPADVAEALDAMIAAGKTKAVAVSNYAPTQLDALAACLRAPLAAHQIELSALHMEPVFDGLLDQAMARKMKVYAWSPLAGGRLFDSADDRAKKMRAALAKHADAAGCDISAAALAFIMKHPAGVVPIVGTKSPARLKNVVAARRVEISRTDWYDIIELSVGRKMP